MELTPCPEGHAACSAPVGRDEHAAMNMTVHPTTLDESSVARNADSANQPWGDSKHRQSHGVLALPGSRMKPRSKRGPEP
jgi:hypothetical protein